MTIPIAAAKDRVRAVVTALLEELFALNVWLYEHPELGNEEHQAAAAIGAMCQRYGFRVEHGVAGLPTALRAVKRGGADRPAVALLAEYDALPGIGHGCGHNVIATSCLGAALALASLGADFPGTVVLLGCPAEETTGGKIDLVEHGAFAGIDLALSVHPGAQSSIGGSSLASHPLQMEFFGRTAHAAAAPQEGINALQALVQAMNAIWMLKTQLRDDVRLPGIILDGGRAPNVIPDYARARFSVRAADAAYLENVVLPRVRACAEAAALATGATVKMHHYEPLFRDLRNNMALSLAFKSNLEALGHTVAVRDATSRGGSTDVGNVSHAVPTIHPHIAMVAPGVGGHTVEFARATVTPAGRRALADAAAAMAMTALDFVLDHGLRARVEAEFRCP